MTNQTELIMNCQAARDLWRSTDRWSRIKALMPRCGMPLQRHLLGNDFALNGIIAAADDLLKRAHSLDLAVGNPHNKVAFSKS